MRVEMRVEMRVDRRVDRRVERRVDRVVERVVERLVERLVERVVEFVAVAADSDPRRAPWPRRVRCHRPWSSHRSVVNHKRCAGGN